MKPFEYSTPKTLDEALAILRDEEGVRILSGGTDLIGEMKRGTISPQRLLSLKSVQGLDSIRQDSHGRVALGSLATLSDIAEHALVRQQYPLLVQSIARTASLQIRNIATLGGNLCQRPRCWYYRHPHFPCFRKHGESCFAVRGQDRYHAIFGGHRCFMVHPSDPASALMALDARVQIARSEGSRTVPLHEFFIGPHERLTQENILTPHEILTEIQLSPSPPDARSIYLKVAERKAIDFALASVALHLAWKGTRVNHARIVLGGVAPVPWRVPHVEEILLDEELSEEKIGPMCEAVLEGARPMRHNANKIPLVKGLLRKALHRVLDA